MSLSFRNEILEQLRGMGSDVGREHRFDFFLYLPSESAAMAAGEEVGARGLSVQIKHDPDETGWLCQAKTLLIPATAPFDELGEFFEKIATSLGGEFDGRESDVIKPKRI